MNNHLTAKSQSPRKTKWTQNVVEAKVKRQEEKEEKEEKEEEEEEEKDKYAEERLEVSATSLAPLQTLWFAAK
ncbi:hypothetical protein HZH68_005101 [Vespula germanica]|uniref:Uncharacterized protein n=1 Tax=Vespula germanica TaxID=30212 RepID=A0A834KGY0_VESGE|nr:hypothetical protein HZH68_005101 [Vespula germanica]